MDLKSFLETCPVGRMVEIESQAEPRDDYLQSRGTQNHSKDQWVIPGPRINLYCSVCGGNRNFNPVSSYPLSKTCIDLGYGPRIHDFGGGKNVVSGKNVDQFLRFVCGDCNEESKKYSIAVEIIDPISNESKRALVKLKLTKYGEIPKAIKPINPKIKRLISKEWDLYRKGADDEAAGNGIGAFAYYRRVVESSRDLILDAMCSAASKLNVPEDQIKKIQDTKNSNNFTESIKSIDHIFPSELKFNDQNALTVLYAPLSAGLHERSDEDCLEAAAHIRTLLDALGERLEQVIDREDSIQKALNNLRSFSNNESESQK